MRKIELEPGVSSSAVSVIGFGTYHLLDRMSEADATSSMARATDAGVTLFDTSDNYGTEAVVGEFAASRSEGPFVATKTGLATTYEEFLALRAVGRSCDLSPKRIKRQLQVSREILRMDVIDLYQLHVHDPFVPPAEVARLMDEAVETGAIRYYGVSNYTAEQLETLLEVCDRRGFTRPTTLQPFHNVLSGAISTVAVDLARDQGIAVLAHSPLAKGALSEETLDWFCELLDSSQATDGIPAETLSQLRETGSLLQSLRSMANISGHTLSELALAWLLNQPRTVALTACTTEAHIASATKATEWILSKEQAGLVNDVVSNEAVQKSGPVFWANAANARPYYAKKSG